MTQSYKSNDQATINIFNNDQYANKIPQIPMELSTEWKRNEKEIGNVNSNDE